MARILEIDMREEVTLGGGSKPAGQNAPVGALEDLGGALRMPERISRCNPAPARRPPERTCEERNEPFRDVVDEPVLVKEPFRHAVEEPAVVGEPVHHDRDRFPIRNRRRDIISALFVARGVDNIYPPFSLSSPASLQ